MENLRPPVLIGGGLACAAALLVQHFHLQWTLDDLGEFLFGCLQTDVVGFGLPALYFRLVVPGVGEESWTLVVTLSVLVGGVALANLRLWEQGEVSSFALLFAALAAAYVLPCRQIPGLGLRVLLAASAGAAVAWVTHTGHLLEAAKLACAVVTMYFGDLALRARVPGRAARLAAMLPLGAAGLLALPPAAVATAKFLLPIDELSGAYELVGHFIGVERQQRFALKLLIVTTLCQVSLGFLGIAFLRKGQERKNSLLAVGAGRITARAYAHLVFVYMVATALPYMFQRTIMENVDSNVSGRIQRELERSMRIGSFFPQNASSGDLLLGAIHGSKYTVEGYTDAFNAVVGLIHRTVEEKLFSLPKLVLLPGMLVNQPMLVVSVLPASIVLDIGRTRIVTQLARRIEQLSRQIQDLANRRRKVEEHDAKNEELIRRGASGAFVEANWRAMAKELESLSLRYQSLTSLRAFINWLYNQDVLGPGIELVLAWLLEFGHIPIGDIWVYTRVVEETIDLLLTRFRMDAKLATLRTNMNRVSTLLDSLEAMRKRGRATCATVSGGGAVRIAGLRYSRGTSLEVQIEELALKAGRVIAVTGPNGSGKSSFFGILASCGKSATMLPAGLEIKELKSLELLSDEVVEITQQPYCPRYAKPLAWILGQTDLSKMPEEELKRLEVRVAELSQTLELHRRDDGDANQETGLTTKELHTETEDWYGQLSGGQRGKVEFMRQVFLREHCPRILLLDEAFAPLDPESKKLVQRRLKEFCKDSVVLVIYHGGAGDSCVPASGFFDENLHFGNGTAGLVPTCPEL